MDVMIDMNAAESWLNEQVEKGKKRPFSIMGVLTPALAQVLLTRNPNNRNIIPRAVDRYVASLRAGDWELTGQTVIISADGLLNDGQHRCAAVAKSGIPMPMTFAFGLTRKSRDKADSGLKKTNAQRFQMHNTANAALLASTLNWMETIRTGFSSRVRLEFADMERLYAQNPDIVEDKGHAQSAAKKYQQPTGMFVALNYLFRQNHPEKTIEFFSMLSSGVAPHARHPVALLSSRLTDNLTNKSKLPPDHVAVLTIKAMRAFVAGKEIQALKWHHNAIVKGDKTIAAEPFPEIP